MGGTEDTVEDALVELQRELEATRAPHVCACCHSQLFSAKKRSHEYAGVLLALSIIGFIISGLAGWGHLMGGLFVTGSGSLLYMEHFNRFRCDICGSDDVIPSSSPRGKAILDS